jgi:hypothetical protein
VTWDDWKRAELYSLRSMLRHYYADLAAAGAVWVKIGTPPTDPLRAEIDRTLRETAILGELVGDLLSRLEYRPLVNPWQGSGLNVSIRPDFEVRDIRHHDP